VYNRLAVYGIEASVSQTSQAACTEKQTTQIAQIKKGQTGSSKRPQSITKAASKGNSTGSKRVKGKRQQQCTLRKPYSVNATKAIGAVEMKTPAIGMKLQMKTNSPNRPIPGIWRSHIPSAVNAVLAIAICACSSREKAEAEDLKPEWGFQNVSQTQGCG